MSVGAESRERTVGQAVQGGGGRPEPHHRARLRRSVSGRQVLRVSRFTIEFYEDEHGDSPVLRWLREELTPTQRRAIGVAMTEILQEEGVGVCRTGYGKQQPGDGLFEFRLRHDAAEILRSVGKSPLVPSRAANASSCASSATLYGDRIVLLLGGYDKGR